MKHTKLLPIIRALLYTGGLVAAFLAYCYNETFIQMNNLYLETEDWGAYDYHVISSEVFLHGLIAIFITAITVDLLVTRPRTSKRNSRPLVYSALLIFSVNVLSVLDILLSSWSIPRSCGRGFSLGNCFMLEGLSEIIYVYSIPTLYIIGTILLIINYRRKIKLTRNKRRKAN